MCADEVQAVCMGLKCQLYLWGEGDSGRREDADDGVVRRDVKCFDR